MAPGEAASSVLAGSAPAPIQVPPGVPPSRDDGLPASFLPPRKEPVISNARLGMLVFLAFETMFFGGLLGAFLVFRLSSVHWPPPGQPYLPGAITWINTVILLSSSCTLRLALRAVRGGDLARLLHWLGFTAALGIVFLVVQGTEWIRLVHFGLTLASGTYGSTFYTLIGCHGLHVSAAVLWLLIVLLQAMGGRYTAGDHAGVRLCAMYWNFVVGLWPILFGLVYLY